MEGSVGSRRTRPAFRIFQRSCPKRESKDLYQALRVLVHRGSSQIPRTKEPIQVR